MSSGAAPSAAGAPRNLVLATVGFALNFWAWALLGPLAPGITQRLGCRRRRRRPRGLRPPLIMGWVFDLEGSYAIGLMLLSNIALAAAVYTAVRMRDRPDEATATSR